MKTLTVTERGQVTVRKEMMQHLGIRPGEKIEWEKQTDGAITLRAERPLGTIDGCFGLLARRTRKVARLDEMNEAAAAGWSTLKLKSLPIPRSARWWQTTVPCKLMMSLHH